MSKLMKHVGARIRMLRKNRGLTQEQLGEILQQPQSYVAITEQGKKNISLDTIERIIDALEIEPTVLFESYKKEKTKAQSEMDMLIDSIRLKLQERKPDEIRTISRIIDDVLKAYDTKGH